MHHVKVLAAVADQLRQQNQPTALYNGMIAQLQTML